MTGRKLRNTHTSDLAIANTPDQDDVPAVQGDEPLQVCDEPSGDRPIDFGISLPSPSRAERKVAVKSKGHFCGHLVVGDREKQVIAVESHLEMNCALVLIESEPYCYQGVLVRS
jgi:hypothetical protein